MRVLLKERWCAAIALRAEEIIIMSSPIPKPKKGFSLVDPDNDLITFGQRI